LAFPAGLVFQSLFGRELQAVGRVPQENDPEHRHEVIARSELRVRAEIVRGSPQICFQLPKALLVNSGHAG